MRFPTAPVEVGALPPAASAGLLWRLDDKGRVYCAWCCWRHGNGHAGDCLHRHQREVG